MRDREPTVRTIEISDFDDEWAELVGEVAREHARVIVERAGTPVAALVSAADPQRFDRLDRAWEERTRALETFGAAFADEPTDRIERRVARIVAHGWEATPTPRPT